MTVSELLAQSSTGLSIPPSLASQSVAGLAYDSRRVVAGFLFFAFPGARADGRAFAREAIAKGALAVVSELPPEAGWQEPWIQVEHGRRTLALAAKRFYGD